MKNKKFKILTFIILGFVAVFSIFKINSQKNKSYKVKGIYKSQRAFGDDYFDIYEIIIDDKNIIEGKIIDDDYYKKSKGFKQIMKASKEGIDNYGNILHSIELLEKDPNTIYVYQEDVDKKDHKSLFIINYDLNKGYILDLQIWNFKLRLLASYLCKTYWFAYYIAVFTFLYDHNIVKKIKVILLKMKG